MKFYDRTQELELLRDINKQSRNTACFTVMVVKPLYCSKA